MEITIGWWIVPLIISLGTIAFGFMPAPRATGWNSLGDDIVGAFYLMLACIVSLTAWLIWSLLA